MRNSFIFISTLSWNLYISYKSCSRTQSFFFSLSLFSFYPLAIICWCWFIRPKSSHRLLTFMEMVLRVGSVGLLSLCVVSGTFPVVSPASHPASHMDSQATQSECSKRQEAETAIFTRYRPRSTCLIILSAFSLVNTIINHRPPLPDCKGRAMTLTGHS